MYSLQLILLLMQVLYIRSVLTRRQRRLLAYRRQRFLRGALLNSILLGPASVTSLAKSKWTFTRSSHWWKCVVLQTFSPKDWLENFRMSKDTFLYLCDRLRSTICKKDSNMRKAITVDHRVAVTVWTLATPCEYRTIGHLFGISRSSVCKIVHETCEAICNVLLQEYIRFPKSNELETTIRRFEQKWGVPQCVGAIDGSHIPVCAPANMHTDYYNRKGWYSMLVQAVVDPDYLFTDLNIGWPGSVHDARVLCHSQLYEQAQSGDILPSTHSKTISGVSVPPYLIGDAAYPLKTWLMKPFPDRGLSDDRRRYNYRMSRARMVVENAFGRLKGRWRRLLKRNDMSLERVPTVIAACGVLHNICEVFKESYDERWNTEDDDDRPQPNTSTEDEVDSSRPGNIRNALMKYFEEH